VFDQAYACTRDFLSLTPIGRIRLADSLCSNLSVLSASVASLLQSGNGDAAGGADAAASHREALKTYSTLIYWLANAADGEAHDAPSAAATSAPGAGKADKKAASKKKSAPLVEWKWEEQRERVMHTMSGVLDVDLWNLFRPRQPSEAFLGLFTRLACMAMESQAALRSKITKGAAFDMLGACALKWGQLDNVTTALVHLLNKHEHLPGPIAECAAVAAGRHENARLAAALLREVGRVDPAEYKRQQLSDAVGVRCVGVFVAELAERMPKTTMTNISLLLPHLDGEAYSLRSALVTVLGHLVCSDACSGAAGADSDRDRSTSADSAPLLRAKQGFLDLLVERVHDTSAFTRARVLQTWSAMAEKKAIPLSHWLVVADLGIGRLGDRTASVRKAAMNLLATMLGFNPFAPQLPSAAFAESLREYDVKLKTMAPAEAYPGDAIEEGDEEAAAAAAAEEEEGGMTPPSPSLAPVEHTQASQAPVDEDAMEGKDAAEGAAAAAAAHAPELDGGVEAVRTMVAALKTALGFSVQMGGAVVGLCTLNQVDP
jgi:condensin complex subunit 1